MDFTADIPMGQGVKMKLIGKWRQEGDKAYLTMNDVNFENLPAQAKPMEAQIKEAAKKQMQAGTEKVVTVKVDGDTLTLTDDKGSPQTFTRKK